MPEEETFDQITWTCSRCGHPGVITSVVLNLTRIALEGACVHCRISDRMWMDLLELDARLRRAGEESRSDELQVTTSEPLSLTRPTAGLPIVRRSGSADCAKAHSLAPPRTEHSVVTETSADRVVRPASTNWTISPKLYRME